MKDYTIKYSGRISYIQFLFYEDYKDFLHFSTLRIGGNSGHPQASLNLGFVETDFVENVIQNRKLVAEALGFSINQMVFSRQTHSSNIHIISKLDVGKGSLSKETAIPNNDGFVLFEKNICACILTADCVPVFLYDPEKKIAAIVHSGWKGTIKHITAIAIEKMFEYGCRYKDIKVAIGPSIKKCCYEVKDDVVDLVKKSFGKFYKSLITFRNNKVYYDMDKAIEYSLLNKNILPQNIARCDLCTKCNSYMFFSARNSINGYTGRMVSGIMLL